MEAQTALQIYRYITLILNYFSLELSKYVAGKIFHGFLSTDPKFLITESSLLGLYNVIVYFKAKLLKEFDDDESISYSMLDSILKNLFWEMGEHSTHFEIKPI